MSVITHKFWLIVETLPVGNTFLTNNSLFVILKLRVYSILHLCCNHTSLSDTLMFRNNCDVFHALMAGIRETNRNYVVSHFKDSALECIETGRPEQ